MHFHNVSLGFFYDFIYRFKKLFDESVSECRIAFGSPYRYKRRLKKANNVSISLVNTSHHYVIYDLSAATEKYSNFCIFDTLHISYNLVSQPVARHETYKKEKVSTASFRQATLSYRRFLFDMTVCKRKIACLLFICVMQSVSCIHVQDSLLYTLVIQPLVYTCQITCIHE